MKEKAIVNIFRGKQKKAHSRVQVAYLLEDGTVEINTNFAYPNLKAAQQEWDLEEVPETEKEFAPMSV